MAAINIYTDGACIGNPGPGGFAAIINTGGAQYTISGGEPRTTNNRMEIRAALEPLQALNGLQVEPDAAIVIHSDSAYLVNAFSRGWVDRWRQNGWRTRAKRGVKNRDLWVEILEAVRGRHVLFAWNPRAQRPCAERNVRLRLQPAGKACRRNGRAVHRV